MKKTILGLGFLLALGTGSRCAETPRVLESGRFHLGIVGNPEWEEFAGKRPHGPRLDLHFTAAANQREQALFIRQDDVKGDWAVQLNGRVIGKLLPMEADLMQSLVVAPGALQTGENTLSIVPPRERDDILVGQIGLDDRPLKEALGQATLEVRVIEAENHLALPCRITIVDKNGTLATLAALPPAVPPNAPPSTLPSQTTLAVRPGVVYTGSGQARLGLLPGDYTVHATRGFEYGLATRRVSLGAGQTVTVQIELRREVPTPGLVSCDTHVHTYTFSRHGDATIEERVISVAGEGIELPIATDHDYLVDYREAAGQMGVARWFTPVVGCEVTTAKGHFNVFPVVMGSRVPDFRISDWPRLMQSMRATPGVRVVVLNHPRNIHSNFQPFARTNFNAVTGENRRGPEFSFDAIEVLNSSALQSDLTIGVRDWLALLNHGYRVTAVGSSDCHDVSRYIIGQGRSYVRCDDADPAQIQVGTAWESFRQGRVLVSMGLLTELTVEDKFRAGDLATVNRDILRASVKVLGPSWSSADQVVLFANGEKIRERTILAAPGAGASGEKATVTWELPRPRHDVHLVALASGPPVTAPYWALARPYQPSSRVWKPRVVGLTNPVWVDADRDGKFTSARGYAKRLLEQTGGEPAKLIAALGNFDQAVAAQAAGLLVAAGRDLRAPEIGPLWERAPEPVRQGFLAVIGTL